MHNLLKSRCIRVETKEGQTLDADLPETLELLTADRIGTLPRLRAHQQHGWHALTTQLAALAWEQGSAKRLPETKGEWKQALRQLTPGWKNDEPWHLIPVDEESPGFLQPAGHENYRGTPRTRPTPDAIDMLIATKNHELKLETATEAETDDWLFALTTIQTMGGYNGGGSYGISRMNRGFSSRICVALRPAEGGQGAPRLDRDHGRRGVAGKPRAGTRRARTEELEHPAARRHEPVGGRTGGAATRGGTVNEPTQMLHAPVDLRRLRRWAANRGLRYGEGSDNGYVLHVLLAGMFGAGTLQPFRLMGSERSPRGSRTRHADRIRPAGAPGGANRGSTKRQDERSTHTNDRGRHPRVRSGTVDSGGPNRRTGSRRGVPQLAGQEDRHAGTARAVPNPANRHQYGVERTTQRRARTNSSTTRRNRGERPEGVQQTDREGNRTAQGLRLRHAPAATSRRNKPGGVDSAKAEPTRKRDYGTSRGDCSRAA